MLRKGLNGLTAPRIVDQFNKDVDRVGGQAADAVFEAMQNVTYNPWGSTSRNTIELSAKVASLAPDKESRVFLANSGSEANETAMKMAKRYHANRGEPSRFKMIVGSK